MRIVKSTLVFACGGLVAGIVASQGFAAQPYDGDWRVSVKSQTDDSRCQARSVSLRVEEGNVKYAGFLSGLVSGKVDRQGKLRAQMAKVRVSGKLSDVTGSGAWKSPNCAGTWNAHRE